MGSVAAQLSPDMFDWGQVRALAGPLKDIQRLFPMPLLRYLGCVLRSTKATALAEQGEPLLQGLRASDVTD